MKTWRVALADHRALRLCATVGLATVFLAALLWASASSAPTKASAPVGQEASALSNGSVITIGVAAALDGGAGFIGWPQANAVRLAVSQTTGTGTLNIGGITHTLKVVAADSACSGTAGGIAAQALLQAGAVAVVGHTCSGASLVAHSIYNAAGVPMVSASSTALDLTEEGYTTTFRVITRDDAVAALMAKYFRQWLGLDEVAIVELVGLGVDFSPDTFESTFTALGGTASRHPVNSTDEYTAALTAIQAEDPDAIFYADYDPDNAGLLSRIAYTQGMTDVIMGWDTFGGDLEAYATAAGPAADGDYAGVMIPGTGDMPGYDDFNAAYQAAGFPNYGDEAEAWGAFAYDAARIIIAAMDRADSADPAAIRDEIAATADYEGVLGTYEGFDAKGDVIPQWAWLAKYQDGQWARLRPTRVFLPLVLKSS